MCLTMLSCFVQGKTALMYAAGKTCYDAPQMIKLLSGQGVDINAADNDVSNFCTDCASPNSPVKAVIHTV